MRVAVDKLTADAVADLLPGKVPGFLFDLGVEAHLHQHIAQFLTQQCGVVKVDGIHGFIRFLKEIHADGRMRLHFIPRAAVVRVA